MVSRVFDELSKLAMRECYKLAFFGCSTLNDCFLLEMTIKRIFERIGIPDYGNNPFVRYGTACESAYMPFCYFKRAVSINIQDRNDSLSGVLLPRCFDFCIYMAVVNWRGKAVE